MMKGGMKKVSSSKKNSLGKLPKKVRNKMGYMEDGGEKLLMKMAKGGMMDMSEMGNMMQAGYGKQVQKMGMAKKGREYPKRGQRAAKHMKK
ncbi:MAG: hypothetical protein ACW98D_09120 [Promethearchaeota archaeon]